MSQSLLCVFCNLENTAVRAFCGYYRMTLAGRQCWLCSSRKYPYPHHGGNWKFRRGGGVKDPGNSGGQGGWTVDLVSRCPSIQYRFKYRSSCSKILPHLLSRHFTWKNSSLNTFIWIVLHLKLTFFLQKALWKLTSAKNMAAITCYQSTWSHFIDWKALVTSLVCFSHQSWKLLSGSRFLSWKLVSL
jgi:hypothetical protein